MLNVTVSKQESGTMNLSLFCLFTETICTMSFDIYNYIPSFELGSTLNMPAILTYKY